MSKTLRTHLCEHLERTAQHHIEMGKTCADVADHLESQGDEHGAGLFRKKAKQHADHATDCSKAFDAASKLSEAELAKESSMLSQDGVYVRPVTDNVRGIIPSDNPHTTVRLVGRPGGPGDDAGVDQSKHGRLFQRAAVPE